MQVHHIGYRTNADILGKPKVTAQQLIDMVIKTVGHQEDIEEIANCYIKIGCKYGLRGDIAFCQAILETSWFKYDKGTAVRPIHHNYAGLGVVKKGIVGNVYSTVEEGVTAHIQHLYAYACDKEIPEGEKLVDVRFKYVKRGCSPTWYMLGGNWSYQKDYGYKIINIFNRIEGE